MNLEDNPTSCMLTFVKCLVVVALIFMAFKTAYPVTIRAVITGYSANDRRQGTDSHTATGRHARHAGVAVDPRVIPLGSKVRIGRWWYLADDTGVRGRHVDLRFTSRGKAIKWGRKVMVVEYYAPKRINKEEVDLRKFQDLHRRNQLFIWMFWHRRYLQTWDSLTLWEKKINREETYFYCPRYVYNCRDILRGQVFSQDLRRPY